VDKLTSGKTITIKINGEKRPYMVKPAKQEVSPSISDTDLDQVQPESPLRKQVVFEETAASEEIVDESFDWILPEPSESEISEYTFANPTQTKKNSKRKVTTSSLATMKKKGGMLKSILLTTIFAVLIGISFGIVMLKLVVTDHSKQAVVETNLPVKETDVPINNKDSSHVTVTLKPLDAYVVQGGVFSTKEAAIGTSKLAAEKGAPGEIIELNNKNYLFLGMADTIEMAKSLASLYKGNGIADIWAKPFPVPKKTITDVTKEEKAFFDLAPSVFQMLSEVTSNAMVNATIPNESIKTISQTESVMKKIESNKMNHPKIKELKSELVLAMEQVTKYQKTNDKKELINAQQHLLNYFSLYQSL
jgi:stage II sporulation protein B